LTSQIRFDRVTFSWFHAVLVALTNGGGAVGLRTFLLM
jgi:hypothetical protein